MCAHPGKQHLVVGSHLTESSAPLPARSAQSCGLPPATRGLRGGRVSVGCIDMPRHCGRHWFGL